MALEPFQRLMLRDYFDGVTETLIIIPKKNGKSTVMAALGLYHMVVTEDAECVMAAASRDQAAIILRQARGFIRRSPDLQRLMEPKQREISSLVDEGRVRILAADVDTADGVIPTLAIVDELHRHPTADLYGVFRDGLTPRAGKMITISTAGAHADSPLGQLRDTAYRLASFHREGSYNHARSDDETFVMHEWCLDPEADVGDIKLVKTANPASWQTEKALKQRHDSPSTTPWQWQRFACGIWTEGEEPWIEPEAWDRLADRDLTFDGESRTFLGVDLGVEGDSTGIAIVQARGEGFAVRAEILEPNGKPVEVAAVEERVRNLCGRFRVRGVAFDPWNFLRSAEILEAEGLPMVKFPQSPERMSAASATAYRLIQAGKLRHDGDPKLRAHVMAGVTKLTERGWRLARGKGPRRANDALIALAMACQLASSERESVYEAHGLRTI